MGCLDRVSVKIAACAVVGVGLTIAILLAVLAQQQFLGAVAAQVRQQEEITSGYTILLAEAVQHADIHEIDLIMSGMITNPIIDGVTITNAENNQLYQFGAESAVDPRFAKKLPVTVFGDAGVEEIGEITTISKSELPWQSVRDRLENFVLLAITAIFSIVLAVWVTVRLVVLRPVDQLLSSFKNPFEPSVPVVWKSNDEMGELIGAFNVLSNKVHHRVTGLETEIKDHLDNEGKRFKALADATFEAIIIFDNSRILDVNDAASRLFAAPQNELMSKDTELGFALLDLMSKTKHRKTRSYIGQHEIVDGSGQTKTVEISARPITYDCRVVRVAAVRDVTEEVAAREKMEFLAHNDQLTGLPNRARFLAESALRFRKLNGLYQHAIVCLDLDGFKAVNDYFGHAVGDALLQIVGKEILRTVGTDDFVARMGGDEFVLLLSDASDEEALEQILSALIDTVSKPQEIDGKEITIGMSAGVAICSVSVKDHVELLHRADLALYKAKHAGKSCVAFYEKGMEESRQRELKVRDRLKSAIKERSIEVYYQPQISVRSGEIKGFEALARWHDPVLRQVYPDEFIAVAEKFGLIHQLGRSVLEVACETAATWPDHFMIAVNLSPAEFSNSGLVRSVEDILEQTGLAPHRLELEITENVLIADEIQAQKSTADLKKLGVKLAIDDFGTGFSSLSVLQKYPFDRIKIDKSFVLAMSTDQEAQHIVESVIGLGKSLGIAVLAEGVETHQDLIALGISGCHEAQGYLISEPVPQSELNSMLSGISERQKLDWAV